MLEGRRVTDEVMFAHGFRFVQPPLASLPARRERPRHGPPGAGLPPEQGAGGAERADPQSPGQGVRAEERLAAGQPVLDRVRADADQLPGDTLRRRLGRRAVREESAAARTGPDRRVGERGALYT